MKEPDSTTDSAVRWGSYVVEHFSPQPGDVVIITHRGTKRTTRKANTMADALESALEKAERREGVTVGTAPNTYSIQQLGKDKMNGCGWYHRSQLSDDERNRLESDPKDHG